jgi:ABC-2 type transport system permease protein
MKSIWIITKKELNSFFDSLIAYILLVLFLGLSGFFTWIFGVFRPDIFIGGEASLEAFFDTSYVTLFLLIPAVTMRLIAEEKKTGTIELLLTKAVSDRQVILGKFLSSLLLITIALLFTLPYVITIASIGNVDSGQVIFGYVGLFLMSAVYISIGLYLSSITSNQIIAFLLSLFVGSFFQFIFFLISIYSKGFIGEFFNMISMSTHTSNLQRGILDTKDLIYFLSIIFLGLFLAEISLSKRKIAG